MTQNICIYFSDTGGGHRSAADAVEASIRNLLDSSADKDPGITILKETTAEKSHPINRFFVELYNYLLRHHQPLMKYYYGILHILRPEEGANYRLTEKYFDKLFLVQKPNVIVSVHPMISHCTAHAMKMSGIKENTKLIVVITDPNTDLWRAWACPDADLIIAPNDQVKDKLIGWGMDHEKIAVLGMPIHPDFIAPPNIERSDFLTHLGLSPDATTVCINAGWAGGGNMLRIYQEMAAAEVALQCIFLCGHNTSLYEKAMAAAAESDMPTAVLPFHDCMSDLMASVDLMVTKAGGLTTYQAVARRLPIVFDCLTEPMPQERGTIDMLVSQNIAHSINEPQQIVSIIESMSRQENRQLRQLPEAYNLNLTDSAPYSIAQSILKACNPSVRITTKKPEQLRARVRSLNRLESAAE